ncbi:Cpn60 TCP1 domain containing protein [Trichuris trichiura]|uniref:Cpn60 TCP1 domain containing protein n=1 Tax=Trichuris trichiura TaxID=36087 RepID=A0A077ZGJ1_TRITR|nr:Cpn60 TCP1 domain containing protein [Trichuris trichiura]
MPDIEVAHPAAKSVIEISRYFLRSIRIRIEILACFIEAAEILNATKPFSKQNIHPVHIIRALQAELTDVVAHCNDKMGSIDINNEEKLLDVVHSCMD